MKRRSESNKIMKPDADEVPHVSIVDDDESVREAIKSLIRSVGLGANVFASADEFLRSGHLDDTTCLILDIRMPGMSGLELQQTLVSRDYKIPIIFITAQVSDQGARNRALQAGAVDVLSKPFNEDALLKHVYGVLESREGGIWSS